MTTRTREDKADKQKTGEKKNNKGEGGKDCGEDKGLQTHRGTTILRHFFSIWLSC